MIDRGLKLRDVPQAEVGMPRQATMRERLVRNKEVLEAQLADVNKALELLDQNPTFEELQDVVSRAL